MPSVIPDGKQYANNIFIRRRARSLHPSRTPTIQILTAAQCTSTADFPNVKQTRTSAHRRECEQSTTTTDGQWIKLVRSLSTVDDTRYARLFHCRQWSNYDFMRHIFLVVTVKKWLKSAYIYESYRKIKTSVLLFGPLYNTHTKASSSKITVFLTACPRQVIAQYIYAGSASIRNASRLWYQQHAAFHT